VQIQKIRSTKTLEFKALRPKKSSRNVPPAPLIFPENGYRQPKKQRKLNHPRRNKPVLFIYRQQVICHANHRAVSDFSFRLSIHGSVDAYQTFLCP